MRQKQSMEERLRRRREKARLHRMPSFRAAETKIHQQRYARACSARALAYVCAHRFERLAVQALPLADVCPGDVPGLCVGHRVAERGYTTRCGC